MGANFWYKTFIGVFFLNYSDSRVGELKYRKLGTEGLEKERPWYTFIQASH